MNFLKKASLLVPFVLLGVLLLTSHTISDTTLFTDDDDFGIVLVRDGKRDGHENCSDVMYITKGAEAPMPTSIRITIYAAQGMNFQFLREVNISNPANNFGNNSFGSDSQFPYHLFGIYQNLPQNPHNIIFMMEINTPNGNFTVFDDSKIVYPRFCEY